MISTKSNKEKIRWHYTVGTCLEEILACGEIRPATAGVPHGEKPAVWFSIREDWEPTATKLVLNAYGRVVRATMQDMHRFCKGLCRIGVAPETAPYTWKDHKRMSGIKAKVANGLCQAAIIQQSRPGDWFVTYSAVPRHLWVAVEVFEGDRWVPLSESWLGPLLGEAVAS